MPLDCDFNCEVDVSDRRVLKEDDGATAWSKFEVRLHAAGGLITADIEYESYSGQRTADVTRDDFGLDNDVAKKLMQEAFDSGSAAILQDCCDTGIAFWHLESAIRSIFYRSQAEDAIRRIFKNAPATP